MVGVVALAALLFAGCGDASSMRRIETRTDRLRALAGDLALRETEGSRRCEEAARDLERWWHQDVTRFHERAKTAGDRIW